MKKYFIFIFSIVLTIGAYLLNSCTKMDHFYKDYITERIYIGKPDSVWVQPGDQKALIGMLTPRDAEAKQVTIKWSASDSLTFPINRDHETQEYIIENLSENDYTFNIFTEDGTGNRSLEIEMSTKVSGDNFRNSIQNRQLSHSVVFPDSVALFWASRFSETLVRSEVEFTDKNGQSQKIISSPQETLNMLKNIDQTKPIWIQTAHLASPNAFEFFLTEATQLDLEETKRNTLTFETTGYLDAAYIDFKFVRFFEESEVPEPKATDIDMAYALGAGSRGNLFTIDGTGFSAFASSWQDAINAWPIRNPGNLKLERGQAALDLYNSLDEMDRNQMKSAYDNSTATPTFRLSSLTVNDVILLHSSARDLYVAVKVIGTPPATSGTYGNFDIEFKVSRP